MMTWRGFDDMASTDFNISCPSGLERGECDSPAV